MDWKAELTTILPALRRYALFLTRSADDADDLVNDCIVRILGSRTSFDQSRAVLPWALRILRNIFVDAKRKSPAQSNLPADEIAEVSDPTSERRAFERVEVRETLAAIDQLAEPFRDVLVLVSIEGLSYAEASACLEVPVGTVMSRLARARKQLVAILDQAPRQLN